MIRLQKIAHPFKFVFTNLTKNTHENTGTKSQHASMFYLDDSSNCLTVFFLSWRPVLQIFERKNNKTRTSVKPKTHMSGRCPQPTTNT